MLQKFIRSKLQEKLNSFFELSSSSIEGFTIKNLGIKANLLQELSQLIKMPLILVSGSIESVSLNIPWDSLFLTKKEESISVIISGIKISAKLPTDLQREYVIGRKKKIIQKYTQEFSKKATSRLAFLNKLKEHFFGSFCVEVKNIQLEISIQMKHPLFAHLSVESFRFQKDIKTNKTKFVIYNLCLGYRLSKQTKIQQIINRADLTMSGQKTNDTEVDNLETNSIHVSFSNQNFNDVRRLIALIKWHNSFVEVPQKLWPLKPKIIGDASQKKHKMKYIVNMIQYKVTDGKGKNLVKNLKIRREYIRLFENFRKDPSSSAAKFQLNQLEERIQLWKVKQYRKFCLLWAKTFADKAHSNMPIKKQMNDNKPGWLNYWFPKSAQSELKQLQSCLDNTPIQPTKKYFNLLISSIKISLSIRSLTGKEPFLNLISLNNRMQSVKIPLVSLTPVHTKSQIEYQSSQKFTVQKLIIQYDQYSGHHQNHMYLLSEANYKFNSNSQQADEFEDIQNFLQCEMTPIDIKVRVVPLRLRINEDTIQKMSVFKLQKISTSFSNAQNMILKQNSFEQKQQDKSRALMVQSSLYLTMPENMCQKESQQIEILFRNIVFHKNKDQKQLRVELVQVLADLFVETVTLGKSYIFHTDRKEQITNYYENVSILRTSLQMKSFVSTFEESHWIIDPIKMQLKSMAHAKKLIRLVAKLIPHQNDKRSLYKRNMMRRKQSIGEQFMDACSNLNEHLLKSATYSEKTRYDRYVIRNRKDKLTKIQLKGMKVLLQASEIELSNCHVTIYQFIDHNSILMNHEQKWLTFRIWNIKNCYKNINDIQSEIQRMLQLKGSQKQKSVSPPTSMKPSYDFEMEGDIVSVSNFNLYIEVYYENKLKYGIQLVHTAFDLNRDKSIKLQTKLGIAIHQYLQKVNRNRVIEQISRKQYLIEQFKINFTQEHKYNIDESSLKIPSLCINLKPSLLVDAGVLFDKFNIPEQMKIQIRNATVNHLNISTNGNIYKECRPGHFVVAEKVNSDIIVFGKKQALQLTAQSGSKQIPLTQNISLLKIFESEYKFTIQSNFRITNRQANSIEVRIITNKLMSQLRKNQMKNTGIVTFQHLSHAQMDSSEYQNSMRMGKTTGVNLKRSTSLHNRMNEDQDEYNDDEKEIKIKKVVVVKMQNTMNKKDQIRMININDSTESFEDLKQVSSPVPTLQPQHSSQKYNSSGYSVKNEQVVYRKIGPGETIQILLSSQEYYIELLELDRKGEIVQKYHAFKVKQILKSNNQLEVHSHNSLINWDYTEQKEVTSSLIIATTTEVLDRVGATVFYCEILSPVVVCNKIPMELQFRFNKESVDMLQVIESAGKHIKKRSFQAIDKEKVESFSLSRINKTQYTQISLIEFQVGEYHKSFRLDHILEKIPQKQSTGARNKAESLDLRIVDLLCLNNGHHEIQMGIQIRILKYVMKITIFSQFIFVNLTSIEICLQIQQQNYAYPQIKMKGLSQDKAEVNDKNYRQYLKMSNQKIVQPKILQQMFKDYEHNIGIFTGAFDQNITRSARYGNSKTYVASHIYDNYELESSRPSREKQIVYNQCVKLILRKVYIDNKPINLILLVPSLFIINKSEWSFFIKGVGEIKGEQNLKKLAKNSIEYMLISDTIAVQACEETDQIAYNQWMKIKLDTLGIIYYAKQMTSSSGYESREYELRKKRLKKAPKLFFRIVMTKYEYGHQILIEQSQYPPVTFINKCKARVQIRQTTENIFEEMEPNDMAEYASKIPHHVPKFSLSIVEHYQFKNYGDFTLEQNIEKTQKILKKRLKLTVEQYKDKQIVVFEDYDPEQDKNKGVSLVRNQFLIEKLERLAINIDLIEVSILTPHNKQISCACIKGLQFSQQIKHTKKYMKAQIQNMEIFGYNGLQPEHLFYSKSKNSLDVGIIGKKEMFDIFKRKVNTVQHPANRSNFSLANSINLNTSSINLNSSLVPSQLNPQSLISSSYVQSPFFSLLMVLEKHKHATILQKCSIKFSQLVIVINANILIDYLKYFSKQFHIFMSYIRKHQMGRSILKQIDTLLSGGNEENQKIDNHNLDQGDQSGSQSGVYRRNSVSINNLGMVTKKSTNPNKSPKKIAKNHQQNDINSKPIDHEVDILHRGFVIENFSWEGLKITIKFENLQNLQYFIAKKEIKYLLKFITWIGDLRPIQFSTTIVEYQQYTLVKLIELIDINKLIKQLTQMFLQYPLQQAYHVLSFMTKLVGLNDLDQSQQQWKTLKRIAKSVFKVGKRLLEINNNSTTTYVVGADGKLKPNKKYLQQFSQSVGHVDTFMQKIQMFKYEQWRYNQQSKQNRLHLKPCRLQRYCSPQLLMPYQQQKARIQASIFDYLGTKLFHKIVAIYNINKDTILGLTQDLFVLYFTDKEEWVVARPEHVVELYLQKNTKTKSKIGGRGISLGHQNMHKDKILVVMLLVGGKVESEGFNQMKKYVFQQSNLGKSELQIIKNKLMEMRLSNTY